MFSNWFTIEKKCPIMALVNKASGDGRCIREECMFWDEDCCIKLIGKLTKIIEDKYEEGNEILR